VRRSWCCSAPPWAAASSTFGRYRRVSADIASNLRGRLDQRSGIGRDQRPVRFPRRPPRLGRRIAAAMRPYQPCSTFDQLQTRRIIREEDLRALNINWTEGGPLTVSHHVPDEEDLRSYLLDFRKFTSRQRARLLNGVFNVAYRHVTSDEIVDGLVSARAAWKDCGRATPVRRQRDEPQAGEGHGPLDQRKHGRPLHRARSEDRPTRRPRLRSPSPITR
jgi:hypothetical protein